MDVLIKYVAVTWSAVLFAFGPEWLQLASLFLFLVSGYLPKKHVIGTVLLYQLVVLFPVFIGALDYSESIPYSLLVFVGPFAVNSILYSIALTSKSLFKPVLVVFSLIALSVPPLSTISIVSPLPLAGLIFPGMGELGIILFLMLAGALSVANITRALIPLIVGMTIAQSSAANQSNMDIVGVNTANGMPTLMSQAINYTFDRYSQLEVAESSGASIVVFPEGAFGEWKNETQEIFSKSRVGIYGGAREPVDSESYINVLIDAVSGEVIYRQEKPIPLDQKGRLKAVPGENESNDYPGVLICNEIVNPWRAYEVFSTNKKTIIWIANVGWTDKEYISKRLIANVNHWGRLFDKQTVISINKHG